MQLLPLKEAASKLNCSYQFLYRLYRSGELPVVKVGRFVRVSEADLVVWVNAHRIAKVIIEQTEDARKVRDAKRRATGVFLTPADLEPPTAE